MAYMSFQGRVYLGARDTNGQPVDLTSVGNVATLTLNPKRESLKHHETQTGERALDLTLTRTREVSFNLKLEEFLVDNLALGLYSQAVSVAAGSVSGEQVGPNAPILGARYALAHTNVDSLVLTDSAGNTLTRDQHYQASDAHGGITYLDLTGMTPPIQAAYNYAARQDLGIFTAPAPERWLRFEGVNTADDNRPVVVELYRAVFEPVGALDLINNELGELDLSGELLADPTKTPSDPLGRFGNLRGA